MGTRYSPDDSEYSRCKYYYYYVNNHPNGDINNNIMPVDYTVKHLKKFNCDLLEESKIRTGQSISLNNMNQSSIFDDKEDIVAYSQENQMI